MQALADVPSDWKSAVFYIPVPEPDTTGAMIPALETVVVATNSITLLCGSLVTVLAWRAYRRTGSRSLGALALGLGLATVGALVAGVLHQLLGLDLGAGVSVQSFFTAVGFAVLAYSLYAGESVPSDDRTPT